ncbi:M14 family metallopeptidase [Janthinobacterium sp.]|uniref:succinylglutamate desuccinylase/aspartoacylase family protein n=1 Tax=Janthinobacterium sp. TaxID=1871054 RepID=UPI00293D507E|nr:M14 family metallopeptidase [Janthinobacterium sp.]
MHIQHHPFPPPSSGTSRALQSFHFGAPGRGRKVYIQASLHADELPGMLVAHHLRARLLELEAAGKILGEVVLVPVSNPVGLAQMLQGTPFGRFDLATGVNFNRDYRDPTAALIAALAGKLGADGARNVGLIRAEIARILEAWQPLSETEALKKTLQVLAMDADIVLDLHCDNEAVLHLYAGAPLAERAAPLAALMGAEVFLLSRVMGGDPFDEVCGRLWWELAEHFGAAYPIPCACLSVTVELRGETQVTHAQAQGDAQALLAFLAHSGVLDLPAPALPAPRCAPTPLAGVEAIVAPSAGLLVFLKEPGDYVEQGEALADLIDPFSGASVALRAGVSGVLFGRVARRYVHAGMSLAKIAGKLPFRTGKLLSL